MFVKMRPSACNRVGGWLGPQSLQTVRPGAQPPKQGFVGLVDGADTVSVMDFVMMCTDPLGCRFKASAMDRPLIASLYRPRSCKQ